MLARTAGVVAAALCAATGCALDRRLAADAGSPDAFVADAAAWPDASPALLDGGPVVPIDLVGSIQISELVETDGAARGEAIAMILDSPLVPPPKELAREGECVVYGHNPSGVCD